MPTICCNRDTFESPAPAPAGGTRSGDAMSYIEELRTRVETAERRFGLIDEQQRRYSERLISLMDALESSQEGRQTEAAALQGRIDALEHENGELRSMLHALLLGVEAGSRDSLAETLRNLDTRLSGMVRPAAAEAAVVDAVLERGFEAVSDEELAAEIANEPVAELQIDDMPVDEPSADEPSADEPGPDVAAEDVPGEAVEDAIAAAEQAVAALIAGGEGAAPLVAEFALDEAAGIEPALEELADLAAGSPVAELLERLADDAQDLGTTAVELPLDEMAAAPDAAPSPARKQA